ncbi:MAG: tannase/feruloyl esterase family alpha/beta hydrolase [Acidobacteriota bacterium]|nr:tannase/feruloyl esterase family alpha/beta hydrolase [Acidobacteriota bacterium]
MSGSNCAVSNKSRWCVAALFGLNAAVSPSPPLSLWAQTASRSCEDLRAVALVDATVTGAEIQPAGTFTPPLGAALQVPKPFCRVSLTAKPSPSSDIRIEVWLPLPSDWNGRFWGVGNSGYTGRVWYTRLAAHVDAGYVAVSSDGGHQSSGGDKSWARAQPEKVVDFLHRSAHLSAVHGKRIATEFYGRAPARAYFSGFSTGGHEGLMLAQRYPDDYDGIVAGAANQDWTNLYLGIARFQFNWLSDPARFVSPAQLAALHLAAVATCGAADLIEEPDRCDVEAVLRAYQPSDTAPALTASQLASVRALYTGPVGLDGQVMTRLGYVPGSEALWSGMHFGTTPGKGPLVGYMTEFLANWVYDDPAWDHRSFDFARDAAATNRKLAATMNATDADLRPFAKRGGRLILYNGWDDPAVPARLTLDYYQRVMSTLGVETAAQHVRLFMVPGMGHSTGGPGFTQFGQLAPGNGDPERSMSAALQRWVEQDVAPERIIGAKHANPSDPTSDVLRTRPLCAWPYVAGYGGGGSADDATNYACTGPRPR